MATVFLGVGSNIDRERKIGQGLDALAAMFGELALSPVYDSAALGFDGEPFLNLVVRMETRLTLAALATALRRLETEHGRPANATRFSSRHLDLDILAYDELVGQFGTVCLPRGEILENAFVLRPLAELAPQVRHPVDGRTYAALWRDFDQSSQPLWPIDFNWRGQRISSAQ